MKDFWAQPTGCYFYFSSFKVYTVCCLFIQAIPGAVAEVRGSDGKSPLEATDFILHILKVSTEFMYDTTVT